MTHWMRASARRILSWLRPSAAERDFDDELRAHLEMLTDDNIRRGLPPEQAARAARVRLGGMTQLKETRRELAGLPILRDFLQDARYAARALRRQAGFTAVAILTLGLGIGANTAIFSVVYAVLLEPLPYEHAARLVSVAQVQPQQENRATGWSYLNFVDLRAQNHVFDAVAGSQHHQLTLTGSGEPRAVDTSVVTAGFFELFSVRPLMGRLLTPADADKGAAPVVVLSEPFWQSAFGGDPAIVGRAIVLDKRPFTVVGVAPPAFRFPLLTASEQIWIPLAQDPLFGGWTARRGGHWLQVSGRLKEGLTLGQAQAEMDTIAGAASRAYPAENKGWAIRMVPLQRMIVGNVQSALFVLLAAVALVLLIACANLANLLLTRATARTREIAVRAALGASRGRIVRQLFGETAVLGGLGGAAGLAIAVAGVQVLAALVPATVPRVNPIRVDGIVLAFALLLSIAATLAFGLAPSIVAARVDLQGRLREGGRGGETAGRRRVRNVLAAAEVALALVLLTAAGLVLRSFARLTAVDPGFEAQHLLKAEVSLPRFEYATPRQWRTFADLLLARVQAEPGLRDTAIAIPAPIADGFINLGFEIVGAPAPPGASRTANYVAISPEYFGVMGVPLVAGRAFDAHDGPDAARVCIISAAMARLYFAGRDAVGARLDFAFPPDAAAPREIVGVVGDVRDVSLERDPGPMMYVPFAQAPFPGAVLVVKSALAPAAVVSAIRRDVAAIDANLPVTDVGMMPDLLDASVAQPRFRAWLLGAFAATALVLAALGVFGVISNSVSRRTQEIGVRIALGASRGRILRMVLGETAAIAAAGFAVGLPCALAASRLIGHLLFDVSDHDPATLAWVGCVLAAVTVLAGYLPARRATRVAPMVALRED